MNAECLGFVELSEGFGGVGREGEIGGPLGHEIVVVGVEPLGHLHGGLLVGVAGHLEVAIERDGTGAEAGGGGADENEGVEDLVVEGEVVRRDRGDASGLLLLPMARTELFRGGEQLLFCGLTAP